MLTRAENELLTRVGPGTPMGEMLREYWNPAVRAEALEADGAPVRVRMFGENFIAFRASDGRVGFFDEGCPHRCTSLALARNEDNALTCIFHGWKIDVSGKVVEVPSEPPERRAEFAAKVRVRHYPVREAGTIVWVYLGKREQPPPFFNFEPTNLPAGHVKVWRAINHANWVQGLEGLIDSAHVGQLHQGQIRSGAKDRGIANDFRMTNATGAPMFELEDCSYGFREAAMRPLPDGSRYVRIRQFVWPYFAFIPTPPGSEMALVAPVPIDDEWMAQWYIVYRPDHPLSREEQLWCDHFVEGDDPDNFAAAGGMDQNWTQDRAKMKEGHWSGITRSVPFEDFAMQEGQGPIVDRSREYLGHSDQIIIRTRRKLIEGARAFAKGAPPLGLAQPQDYSRLRSMSTQLPMERNWRELDPASVPW
ncbi:MAG TPA: Rieske 2Fe-2S domain-containing protein [Candidatus Binataceae bacterium]|nr:Rieske 2Fe-2S domain-containing protein [Candidatus Binataceae bacterium]